MLLHTDQLLTGAAMVLGLLQALGGLGVFILGMVIMVDGLHSGAGERLQRFLAGSTQSPFTGAITGAVSTSILQSSSATTIAAVGFVSAGLLSFPQALGIIYGANLGTTVTGWLVVFLGFKLQLGTVLLPLIFLGAMLRIFSRGRLSALGYALAGFGLIFLGIGQMQIGMQDFNDVLTPDVFPGDSFVGRLQLIGLGVAFTLITQSSSAGVVTMLTLLYAGSVTFGQAAAVVIGMDLATSVKALIVTLGGRAEARRTGLSHLVFNLATVVIALLMLEPFIYLWETIAGQQIEQSAELALVAFHSAFNLAAVVVMLPFVHIFARFIVFLVPDRSETPSLRLDPLLLREPSVALHAALPQLQQQRDLVCEQLALLLNGERADRERLAELQHNLDHLHKFLDAMDLKPDQARLWHTLMALMHGMDHLQRLHERCDEEPERGITACTMKLLHASLEALRHYLNATPVDPVELEDEYYRLEQHRTRIRQAIIADMVSGDLEVEDGTDQLEALRWLVRVSKHLHRIDFHLQDAMMQDGASLSN